MPHSRLDTRMPSNRARTVYLALSAARPEGGQTRHAGLRAWVGEIAELTRPQAVYWCDGSDEEYERLCEQLVDAGTLTRLSDAKRPSSYLARAHPLGARSDSERP